MNNIELLKKDYKTMLKVKGTEDGYLMVDRMFIEIGEDMNHELSLKSALDFVDFYGYRELSNWEAGKRGFVARAAFDRIGKALENGELSVK